jgi:hypothetical protein
VQGSGTANFDQLTCDSTINGNAGCGGYSPSSTSYGDAFNSVGGGVYAMDWQSDGIKVWMFNRANIPSDITSGNPDTRNWGSPEFVFAGPAANIGSHFSDHKIIFDMTYRTFLGGLIVGFVGIGLGLFLDSMDVRGLVMTLSRIIPVRLRRRFGVLMVWMCTS